MRIFVGGISFASNSDGLRDLFATVGTVSDASIVQDRYTGESKGFGFIDMPNNEEAQVAIKKFNGYLLDGRPLTVNEARPREDRNSSAGRSRSGNNRW